LGPKSYIGINDEPGVIKEKIKGAVTATDIKELIDIGISITGISEASNLTAEYTRLIKTIKKENITNEEVKAIHGIANLNALLRNFGTNEHKEYFNEKFKNGDIKFSELKETLAQDIADYFAPFRAKRKELEAKPEYVKKVLADGAARAKRIASETMREVKEKIGLSA
ncbi:hypothetical protein KJ695_02955, partial [Patescibacteria group bacterium]|nr:hypothetical protein [Patescibacteria group bacterium]